MLLASISAAVPLPYTIHAPQFRGAAGTDMWSRDHYKPKRCKQICFHLCEQLHLKLPQLEDGWFQRAPRGNKSTATVWLVAQLPWQLVNIQHFIAQLNTRCKHTPSRLFASPFMLSEMSDFFVWLDQLREQITWLTDSTGSRIFPLFAQQRCDLRIRKTSRLFQLRLWLYSPLPLTIQLTKCSHS